MSAKPTTPAIRHTVAIPTTTQFQDAVNQAIRILSESPVAFPMQTLDALDQVRRFTGGRVHDHVRGDWSGLVEALRVVSETGFQGAVTPAQIHAVVGYLRGLV